MNTGDITNIASDRQQQPQSSVVSLADAHLTAVQRLQDDFATATRDLLHFRQLAAAQSGRIEALEFELTQAQAKSDLHQNFATSLITRLHTVSMLIAECTNEASRDAHEHRKPTTATVPGLEAVAAELEAKPTTEQ